MQVTMATEAAMQVHDIYVGAALFCSHCLWWVVCDKVSLLPNCTWGRVSRVLVMMSFEVVVPVGGFP